LRLKKAFCKRKGLRIWNDEVSEIIKENTTDSYKCKQRKRMLYTNIKEINYGHSKKSTPEALKMTFIAGELKLIK
jgi:hypothetical protein